MSMNSDNKMVCDRCGDVNTEFSTFPVERKVVSDNVDITNSSIVSIFSNITNSLLNTKVSTKIDVCQTCVSKMFRGFKKDK